MGHYRSEMGYEEEDRREAARQAEKRAAILAGVKAQMKREGVGAVIADLIHALTQSRVYAASKWESRDGD